MKNADLYNESTASTAAKETLDKSVEATVEAWKRNKQHKALVADAPDWEGLKLR
jgi:hypothetical protein|eukprot:COSAG01_NODE_3502_length_5999_cov_31.512542_3_plen_54_part_00